MALEELGQCQTVFSHLLYPQGQRPQAPGQQPGFRGAQIRTVETQVEAQRLDDLLGADHRAAYQIIVTAQILGGAVNHQIRAVLDGLGNDRSGKGVVDKQLGAVGVINTVLNVITIAVSGIAAISLIVGGVGVMNIMLVSITERTREIGVRMALGAKRRTIRMQFVIEAIMLCLIGGIIGILIGIGIGALLGKVAGFVIQNMYSQYANYIIMTVHPSVTAIMLSLFFSMLTGVFFGYYPANKASKMEVIDALRYE